MKQEQKAKTQLKQAMKIEGLQIGKTLTEQIQKTQAKVTAITIPKVITKQKQRMATLQLQKMGLLEATKTEELSVTIPKPRGYVKAVPIIRFPGMKLPSYKGKGMKIPRIQMPKVSKKGYAPSFGGLISQKRIPKVPNPRQITGLETRYKVKMPRVRIPKIRR